MMSQNRQSQKDHLRDDHEAEEVEMLYQINRQQLEILHVLHRQVCPDVPLSSELVRAAQQLGIAVQARAQSRVGEAEPAR
jgi:hypothetical protein